MQIITSSTIIDVTSTSIVISSTNIISVAILRQISFSTPNIQLHRHHISFITDRKKNCCSAVNKADPKLSSNIKYILPRHSLKLILEFHNSKIPQSGYFICRVSINNTNGQQSPLSLSSSNHRCFLHMMTARKVGAVKKVDLNLSADVEKTFALDIYIYIVDSKLWKVDLNLL